MQSGTIELPFVPSVSVVIIAYNQSSYIEQALDSVLMQQTNFSFEIVIGEDCSTDGTAEIISKYASKYPEKIRLLKRDRNIGMINNFVNATSIAAGKYIALLEGDDFWTDPQKLQKQYDFLEQHEQVALCFHDVNHFQQWDGLTLRKFGKMKPELFSELDKIIEENFINTCSTMFRRTAIPNFPTWFFKLSASDWPFFVLVAERGLIGYIDEIMATYRVHEHGIWSSRSVIRKIESELEILKCLNQHFEFRFDGLIKRLRASRYLSLARECAHEGEFASGKIALKKAVEISPNALWGEATKLVVVLIRLYSPTIYKLLKNAIHGYS